MSTNCSSNNNLTHYKKPYYSIEFTAKRLGLEIRINDIPAFNVDNSGFMTLEIPVSEYIINGSNTFSVTTHPLFDDDDEQNDNYINGSSIEVSVYVREDNDVKEKRSLINKVIINPGNAYTDSSKDLESKVIENLDEVKSLSISVIKDANRLDYPLYGIFKKQVVTTWTIENISTTFPNWAWQDGKTISNNDATYTSLVNAYTKLHTAFMNKNLSEIESIAFQRSKELAIAYHLGDPEAGFSYSALGKHIDHDTVKIYDKVFLDNTKLEIIGNGKLARIMDAGQNHPVVFMDKNTGQLYQPQFMWYMNKSNEWVLIR